MDARAPNNAIVCSLTLPPLLDQLLCLFLGILDIDLCIVTVSNLHGVGGRTYQEHVQEAHPE